MNTLLLLTTIFGVSIQGVSNKAFVERSGGRGRFLFLAISCVMGILFFVLTGKNLSFSPEVLPYAIAFGLFYGVCTVFKFLAISCGPLTMTSLVTSYSLMLPTAYGLIFLHDPVSVGFVPGLILLLVSLPLINKKSIDKDDIIYLSYGTLNSKNVIDLSDYKADTDALIIRDLSGSPKTLGEIAQNTSISVIASDDLGFVEIIILAEPMPNSKSFSQVLVRKKKAR